MGYSIYWYREKSIDQAIFKNILNDFNKIRQELDKNNILLAGPMRME